MPSLDANASAEVSFQGATIFQCAGNVKNIARVRNCPEVTLFISLFVHDESHGLGLYLGVVHGVGHGVNHVVGHVVGQTTI